MISTSQSLALWASAILLGSLVLFSIAKPRLSARLEQVQQRSTFQNGLTIGSDESTGSSAHFDSQLRTRQIDRTLTGIQFVVLLLFLATWLFGLLGIFRTRQARQNVREPSQSQSL